MSVKCPDCGRFCRWDPTRSAWWCEFDERTVKVEVVKKEPGSPFGLDGLGIAAVLTKREES